MAIPEQVFQEIKYKNDIESVIAPYVNLKRRGKNLVGICPFHNEKTPSFTVYPESGSFYCFGCGVGGDIFSFVSRIEKLDYIDAVKQLAERSGVTIPQDGFDDSMQRLRNTVYDINRETAKFFHAHLMSSEGKWALDYLVGRGLSVSTIKHFGIGAAPDSWDSLIKHLKAKGFSIADMLQANVIVKSSREGSNSYYDRFRKRVMFPLINIRGNVTAFSGRAMPGDDKKGGKYVNTSDTPVYKKSEHLFAMNFAKNCCDERVILVEGNMDAVALHQAGFNNAVAAFGTAFTKEQAKLLSRYTKEIVLCFDADGAGQKAISRAGEILKETGLEVRVILIPDGKDPDDFIKKHGAARFKALLEGAVSELEYKLLGAVEGIDIGSDNGKLQYLSKAAKILADTNDVMARDLYIGRLSEKYGVSKAALQTRVEEIRRSNKRNTEKKMISEIITPRYNSGDINPDKRLNFAAACAEEAVIAILMQHPDLCNTAFDDLPADKMITGLNSRIYALIYEFSMAGRDLDISYFGEKLSGDEMGYLVSLVNSEKSGKNPLIVLKDSIKVILEAGINKSLSSSADMSVEDWAANLQKIIENKKKGNY